MHVLIPIKNLDFAKQRFASLLNAIERRNFFQAMLHDVLSVLDTHSMIDGITLVSDDPNTQALTQHYQLNCINQASLNTHGLSKTVKAGVRYLALQNISDVMILHGDLPLIDANEVSKLIRHYQAAKKPSVLLTPDRHGNGSNCIICPTQSDFEFQYGEHSFKKHYQQALSCGLKPQVIEQDCIGCDIDYPHDLLQFLTLSKINNSVHTQNFLCEHAIIDRLVAQMLEQSVALPIELIKNKTSFKPSTVKTTGLANLVKLAIKKSQKYYAR